MNNAINVPYYAPNPCSYAVTAIIRWDDGDERELNDYMDEPIVCPQVHRHGPEITLADTDKAKHRFHIPRGVVGYTITYLTCTMLTAADHEERASNAPPVITGTLIRKDKEAK